MVRELDVRSGDPAARRREGLRTHAESATEAAAADPGVVAVARAVAAARDAFPSDVQLVPDSVVHRAADGASIVRLGQVHRGIPVFQAVTTVRVGPPELAPVVSGTPITVPPGTPLLPTLAPGAAAAAAVAHVWTDGPAPRPTGAPAHIVAAFAAPSRPTVLRKNRVRGAITAELHLFGRGGGEGDGDGGVDLVWLLHLDDAAGLGQRVAVRAAGDRAGEIVYCRATSAHAAGRARVYLSRHDAAAAPRELPCPVPVADLPSAEGAAPPDPVAVFPGSWIDGRHTAGNNVDARSGNRGRVKGRLRDGEVVFDVAVDGHEHAIVNAFFLCNYLHDVFYLLGFTEATKNLQKRHPRSGAGDGDELRLRVFENPVDGGGSFRNFPDGLSPELHLGLWAPTGRRTALDPDFVLHEYAHAVTDRLVGGGVEVHPLQHPQSRALAEGWSDYFALTLQGYGLPGEEIPTAIGVWASGDPAGIRRHRYDAAHPGHYGDLGRPGYEEAHDAGGVWCAALMELHRRLADAVVAAGGDRRGAHRMAWRLVVASLKEVPVGPRAPSFLDARDALAVAVDAAGTAGSLAPLDAVAVRALQGGVFHWYGMGPAAASPGATYDVVVADVDPTRPPIGGPA